MREGYLYKLVLFLFFFSGFSALIYEIVWIKWFGYVFGITIYAVTTVVASFMAGLALGSYLFGRYIDRKKNPLKTYILLEIGIGLYAVLFPFIISGTNSIYITLSKYLQFSLFVHSLGLFVLGFLLLLVPTVFMGATLPVMVKFMVRKLEHVGGNVGDLYSLNTYGGAAGVLVSAFILIPNLGLTLSTYTAVLFNLIIAGAFILISGKIVYASKVKEQEKRLPGKFLDRPVFYILLLAFGLSGFASLAYEVLWARMMMPVFGIHVYSFALLLATFLFGIATGSLIFSRFLENRKRPVFMFALVELFIGVGGVLSVIIFNYLGVFGNQFGGYLVMLMPTVFMGMSFPLVSELLGRDIGILGKTIGSVYSVNTIGAIAGTFVAGFLLLGFLGIQTSVLLIAVMNFALCLAILMVCKEVKMGLKVSLVIVSVAIILATPVINHRFSRNVFGGSGENLLYYEEGVSTTVSVGEMGGSLYMKINGKTLGSTAAIDSKVQSFSTHLPLLFHEDPEEVLLIGLGTGMSAGVVTLYPVKTIDVAEISPEVVESSELFSEFNYNLSKNPRYNLIVDDARNYLLKMDKKYDIITAEPMDPYIAGSGNLFTREYFELVKKRLNRGGVAAQWVPMYSMSNDDFKTVIKTFKSVFNHAQTWIIVNEIILIGSNEEVNISEERVNEAFKDEGIRADLKGIGIINSDYLLGHFLFDEADTEEYAKDARINTDDFPIIEYNTPKNLIKNTIEENKRSILEFRRTREAY